MAAIVALSVAGIGDFIRRYGEGLSTKGIFIPSQGVPPVGTQFELRVDGPEGHTLFSAGAHVEWVRAPGAPDGPSGVYLSFDVLNKDARAFLAMVEQRNAPAVAPSAPPVDEVSLDELSAPEPGPAYEAPPPAPAEPEPPHAPEKRSPDQIPGLMEFLDAVGEPVHDTVTSTVPPDVQDETNPAIAALPVNEETNPAIAPLVKEETDPAIAPLPDPVSPPPSVSDETNPSILPPFTWSESGASDTHETPAARRPDAPRPAPVVEVDDDFGDAADPGILKLDTTTSAALLQPEVAQEEAPAPVPPPPEPVAPPPPAMPTPVVASPAEPSPAPPPVRPVPERRLVDMPPSALIIGIDLGTTFSCAAVVRGGKGAEVIPSESGHRTIPSVVTVTDTVEVVGWVAYDKLATFPKQTIYGHKRLLGRDFNSQAVQDALKYFDYEIVPDESGEAGVRIGGRVYALSWVSSRILEEVKEWAQRHTNENVMKAIITVPAYYSDRQRQAVMDAGREAGLDVLRIVNEPTAAAIAYGSNRGLDQKIMVYDFGGGTFDVSILEVAGNVIDVIATGGDPYLGGVDLDNRIVDWLLQDFQQKENLDISRDKVVKLRLRQAAETAKRDLSQKNETRINVPYVAIKHDKPCHVDVVLTRDKLNRLVADLVDRSIEICRGVLEEAKLTNEDIHEVLFVGGQTRMPLIQGKVHAFTGKQPRKGVHPDEAVAIGAALLGHGFDKVDAITLIDVVSLPIGVGLPGGRFKPVINAQSKLPVSREFTITTTRDGQPSIVVDIYQGEFDRVDFNDFLGSVKIVDLPPRLKGQVSAKIDFKLDAQGFLTITYEDSVTKTPAKAKLVTKDTPETLKEAHFEAERERKEAEAEAAKRGEAAPPPKKPGLIRRLFGAK